jgi:hypothetical protein
MEVQADRRAPRPNHKEPYAWWSFNHGPTERIVLTRFSAVQYPLRLSNVRTADFAAYRDDRLDRSNRRLRENPRPSFDC